MKILKIIETFDLNNISNKTLSYFATCLGNNNIDCD